MALSIKDDEADRLARRLAAADRGEPDRRGAGGAAGTAAAGRGADSGAAAARRAASDPQALLPAAGAGPPEPGGDPRLRRARAAELRDREPWSSTPRR